MRFRDVDIGGIRIFYREAGTPGLPKLVLLHGFPSSSHQFRDLIPLLAPHFHVIAPDYPGFGHSDMPDPDGFAYTFDNVSTIIERLLERIGFDRFGLFVHDYGGPVGYRIVSRHAHWLEWLVVQNANLYEIGFTVAWDDLRGAFWRERDPLHEAALLRFFEPEAVRSFYLDGTAQPDLVSPDNWTTDLHFLGRPDAHRVQLDYFYDYRNNVALYPAWRAVLRSIAPPTLLFWGQHDPFFSPAGGEAYLADLPEATLVPLATGHFAIDEHAELIGCRIVEFHAALAGR